MIVELSMSFDADFADLFEVKDRQLTKKGEVDATRQRRSGRAQLPAGAVLPPHHRSCRGGNPQPGSGNLLAQAGPSCLLDHDAASVVRVLPTSTGALARTGRSVKALRRSQVRAGWTTWRPGSRRPHTGDRLGRPAAHLRPEPPRPGRAPVARSDSSRRERSARGRASLVHGRVRPGQPAHQLSSPAVRAPARLRVTAGPGGRQAEKMDDFRDAEPGKILHELRFGELTYFHERPQSPYYGSADSTPLFLILLDEYERWSGDTRPGTHAGAAARAAVKWIEDYGDQDGDGYIEYQRRNETSGLQNHCWKDSWNSICHPDGRLASLPRATCELQGYAYDARLRTARLAREIFDDKPLADRLESDAAALKARFNEDFWVEPEGFFALALDGDKKRVRTLASNMGQLLWSGIVDDSRVDSVVGAPDGRPLVQRLGDPNAGQRPGRIQPSQLSQRHRLAA